MDQEVCMCTVIACTCINASIIWVEVMMCMGVETMTVWMWIRRCVCVLCDSKWLHVRVLSHQVCVCAGNIHIASQVALMCMTDSMYVELEVRGVCDSIFMQSYICVCVYVEHPYPKPSGPDMYEWQCRCGQWGAWRMWQYIHAIICMCMCGSPTHTHAQAKWSWWYVDHQVRAYCMCTTYIHTHMFYHKKMHTSLNFASQVWLAPRQNSGIFSLQIHTFIHTYMHTYMHT